MRSLFLGFVVCTTMAACGDDEAPSKVTATNKPDATKSDAAKSDADDPDAAKPGPPGISAESMRKVTERLQKRMADGNRMPGMPNEGLDGNPKTALEAARRIDTAKLGTFTEDEATRFLAAAREILDADKTDHAAILQKHGMSTMRYRLIESLFKRAEGTGPALTELQEKIVAPWLETWRQSAGRK